MNDSNSSNLTFLQTLLQRCANQRLAFKCAALLLAIALLLLAGLGKLNAPMLLITNAPLLLVALMDAAVSAQERRCFTLLAKLAENGNSNKLSAAELAWPLAPEDAGTSAQRTVLAFLSLSVWPFYLALGGIVAAGAASIAPKSPMLASAAHSAGCGSSGCGGGAAGCGGGAGGGGCGGAGGCGGGCGASSSASLPKSSSANPQSQSGFGAPHTQVPGTQGTQSGQPRPGFFPITPAQGNRPVNIQQQPINVMPQQGSPVLVPVQPTNPQPDTIQLQKPVSAPQSLQSLTTPKPASSAPAPP